MSERHDWSLLRQQMPITNRFAYFDNAAVAPLSKPSAEAIRGWATEAAELGDTVWPQWAKRVEKLRESAASLLGATVDELAILNNTTAGINVVAEGFPWNKGDNLVTFDDEFPSNLYPWLNLAQRGVEVRRVSGGAGGLDRIFQSCDQATRLISVSWVSFSSGWRLDLDSLVDQAHRKGILVMLDAIQGLGVFPLDVRQTPIDFASADGHKWLLGPEGASLFYLQARHLDLLRPLNLGWNSVVQRYDYSNTDLNIRAQAARYEGGSQNMVGAAGLLASLQLLCQHGLSAQDATLGNRVIELTDYAVDRLLSLGATIYSDRQEGHKSAIVSFGVSDHDPAKLRQRCMEADVVISCRSGRLRISPHAYNNEEDIDRLIDVLSVVA